LPEDCEKCKAEMLVSFMWFWKNTQCHMIVIDHFFIFKIL
jgi:hypothetical protein